MLEDTTAVDAGSAYIFDIDGNQLAKIQASDAQEPVMLKPMIILVRQLLFQIHGL
jgi:hypothetical protein